MADISKLIEQLVDDEEKLYLLKNRDLIAQDNFTVLQNDNSSTKIKIIMPTKLGNEEIDDNYNFYIDYIDGAGKPGVISNDENIIKHIYKYDETKEEKVRELNSEEYDIQDDNLIIYENIVNNEETSTNNNEETSTNNNEETSINNNEETSNNKTTIGSIKISSIKNNSFILDGENYYIENNTKYSRDGRTYTSRIKYENFEDSAEISLDYPSKYSDILYFIKEGKLLSSGVTGTPPPYEQITVEKIQSIKVNNTEVSRQTFRIDTREVEGKVLSFVYDNKTYSATLPRENGTYPALSNEDTINFTISYITTQNYAYIDWSLDQKVTNALGDVTFSVRIEKRNGENEEKGKNFIYQSNPTTFKVTSNLKETYYLKEEIEENYIIQGREIKPVGNFNNILVKGDTNSNKLFYKMNRYYQGQDILAKKTYSYEKDGHSYGPYNVYKNINNVFCYEDNELNKKLLNVIYTINNVSIYDSKETGTYDNLNNEFTIEDRTYEILKLYKKPFYSNVTQDYFYDYVLEVIKKEENTETTNTETTPESQEIVLASGLNSDITLDEGTETPLKCHINIRALGTSYEPYQRETSIDNQEVLLSEVTYLGKVVPVFNRQIRFVFTSPQNDYGDWNDATIEYINEEEEYFIFSWTPNNQVTRAAGQLKYYIEFFINGTFERVEENGQINVVRTKTYSWSTLPSVLTIQDNAVATATVNYIPHWVSYLENEMEAVLDEFLHSDLQSQYDSLENYFIYSMLGDYDGMALSERVEVDNNIIYRVVLNGITYNITKIPIINNQTIEKYRVTITNNTINAYHEFVAEELSDGSLYSGALQLNKYDYYIERIFFNKNSDGVAITSADFEIDEDDEKNIKFSPNYNGKFTGTPETVDAYIDVSAETCKHTFSLKWTENELTEVHWNNNDDGINLNFTVSEDNGYKYLSIVGPKMTIQLPDIQQKTLEAVNNEYGQKISIITYPVYNTKLIQDYYIIYNLTTDQFSFYPLHNSEGNVIPFLQYVKERLASWEQEVTNMRDERNAELEEIRDETITKYGLGDIGETTVYEQILQNYDNLNDALMFLYNGTMNAAVLNRYINGNQITTTSDENGYTTYTYENNVYYCQILADYNTEIIEGLNLASNFVVNYGLSKEHLFQKDKNPYKKEIIEGELVSKIIYILNESYNSSREYYNPVVAVKEEGDNPVLKGWYELIEGIYEPSSDETAALEKTYYIITDEQKIEPTIEPLYTTAPENQNTYFVLNDLYERIIQLVESKKTEMQSANDLALQQINSNINDKFEQVDRVQDTKTNELTLQYNVTIAGLYEQIAAIVNANSLERIQILERDIANLLNTQTKIPSFASQGSTLIIQPNE